jgi:DNA-binding transcriptional MocR family regulator
LLDRDSAVPLYLQIRDALRSEILAGEYQDGDRLHGEADLVQRFGVARGTVRQALDLLEREGYLRWERCRGTFVSRTGIAAGTPVANPPTISFIAPHCRRHAQRLPAVRVVRTCRGMGLRDPSYPSGCPQERRSVAGREA